MFQYYLIHYFNFKNAGGFMLVSLRLPDRSACDRYSDSKA